MKLTYTSLLLFFIVTNLQNLHAADEIKCYKTTGNTEISYLRTSISGKNLSGIVLEEDEVWGGIFYSFSGEIINDSLFKVTLHNIPEDSEEFWKIKTNGKSLEIHGISLTDGPVNFTSLKCEEFPDISDYNSVEDILSEMEGEASENDFPTVFYSYYPTGGSQRLREKEYIQLWESDGLFRGFGAGLSEGDPDWSFHFEGQYTTGDTVVLDATYFLEGYSPEECCDTILSHETWIVNLQKGFLIPVYRKPSETLIPMHSKFHVIDWTSIDEWALKLINKHK